MVNWGEIVPALQMSWHKKGWLGGDRPGTTNALVGKGLIGGNRPGTTNALAGKWLMGEIDPALQMPWQAKS